MLPNCTLFFQGFVYSDDLVKELKQVGKYKLFY